MSSAAGIREPPRCRSTFPGDTLLHQALVPGRIKDAGANGKFYRASGGEALFVAKQAVLPRISASEHNKLFTVHRGPNIHRMPKQRICADRQTGFEGPPEKRIHVILRLQKHFARHNLLLINSVHKHSLSRQPSQQTFEERSCKKIHGESIQSLHRRVVHGEKLIQTPTLQINLDADPCPLGLPYILSRSLLIAPEQALPITLYWHDHTGSLDHHIAMKRNQLFLKERKAGEERHGTDGMSPRIESLPKFLGGIGSPSEWAGPFDSVAKTSNKPKISTALPASTAGITVLITAAAAAAFAWWAPGLLPALMVLVVGFGSGQRFLLGLGLLSLAAFLSGYYYNLEATLLVKSIVLGVSGGVMLLLRFALGRSGGTPHA